MLEPQKRIDISPAEMYRYTVFIKRHNPYLNLF